MTSYCVITWRVICEIISVHLSPRCLDFEVFSVINLRDETQKCFPAPVHQRLDATVGFFCGRSWCQEPRSFVSEENQ